MYNISLKIAKMMVGDDLMYNVAGVIQMYLLFFYKNVCDVFLVID